MPSPAVTSGPHANRNETTPGNAAPALEISGLSVGFDTEDGHLSIIRDLDLVVEKGETLAMVGESGCGKSLTALAVMGLIDPPGRITSGTIRLRGEELTDKSERELRGFRGRRMGMVFQEPMTSLNPVMRVSEQIGEVLKVHLGLLGAAAERRVVEILELVHIPAAKERARQYPHELSGGMKQRVMIAIALACDPDLLIADEPTTALDVTVQAQILALMRELKQALDMSVLLITHNLGVVAHHADRVSVMYAGEVVEQALVKDLFAEPQHPYTRALLGALPDARKSGQALTSIAGMVPTPDHFPSGCRFATRCPERLAHCHEKRPKPTRVSALHTLSCWLMENGDG